MQGQMQLYINLKPTSRMTTANFINNLNTRFFKGELSSDFINQLEQLPVDRPDVFAFVERMFNFMNQAKVPATDLSTMTGEILGTLLARILPGAWEGTVPPITLPGRHAAVDAYIKWVTGDSSASMYMLDIGCGFPPYTTLDTAKAFPSWNILGVDPSLPVYLIYDEHGNYATLDKNKKTVYFQPALPTVENWNTLLGDAAATKQRFEDLLEQLIDQPSGAPDSLPRLEKNPIENYQTAKLSFEHGGIGQVTINPKDVIRCFNVLFYFNDDFYKNALIWFAKNTTENGHVIIGANWAASTESYYNVYIKKGETLVNSEFAFSIDCLSPLGIVPWYANYDDDRQTAELIKYIAILRSDNEFMQEFYKVHDAQRATTGVCPRNEAGYYGVLDPSIGPYQVWNIASGFVEELNQAGLNSKAACVLKRAGLNAGVNAVGHICVYY